MKINFSKYQGTGNDFVLIDNRDNKILLNKQQINAICDRRFGIGADGLILLELESNYDFKMVYFNSDGGVSSMCGNGGRCITSFAHDCGIHQNEYKFLAADGDHIAWIDDKGIVRLKMNDVNTIENRGSYDFLNTGSPHLVKTVQGLKSYNVYQEGKAIRYSSRYKDEGVNVNFVEVLDEDEIFVRTYERGVEDETYSCGTGVTAAALVNAHNDRGFNHIEVKTLGGNLFVEFDKINDTSFENIWLCGPAVKVFEGSLTLPSPKERD